VSVDWAAVRVGDERRFDAGEIGRFHFVRYAGASGDFNPLHYDDAAARDAGQQRVFGQGMLTAGILSGIPAAWFGPESLRRFAVRFRARLWPGDRVSCWGRVVRVYRQGDRLHADLLLSAKNQNGDVLVRGEATVREWRP